MADLLLRGLRIPVEKLIGGKYHSGRTEAALKAVLADTPDMAIYLVLEEGDSDIDRGPILTELWDRVRRAGIEIRLVGRPIEKQDGS